ncbi:hypothetical protein FQR65_LT16158 [Abscondita terminalis]|nr:hypothetical protein FQR65_LT16158 [Abscondita terminalis]
MVHEINSEYPHKYDLLRNYIQIVMHEAMKMQPPETFYQPANASERISTLFLELLERQFPIDTPSQILKLKTANEFAVQLNIHTNTLNRALKESTGKTTTEWIAERMLKEAKALLQFSNWDVAQIAYSLGFEHSSNFIIFFKKQADSTPLQFRKEIGVANTQKESNYVTDDFWVVKGLVKAYHRDIDGKEHIMQFAMEDWWVTDYQAYFNQTKATLNVDCLEDTAVLCGHGTMWDFADNAELEKITADVYENGGVVGAVCHGPAGLVNVKLNNGKYLVDGKKINAFTNEEETAVKLETLFRFLLERKLIERGAKFEKSEPWQPHVTIDQRVITGQNPQSAKGVGEAILAELKKLK